MAFRRFGFEQEIDDSLKFMPLDVRRKLDLVGRRISLATWVALPLAARRELAEGADAGFDALVDGLAAAVGRPTERTEPSAAWREAAALALVAERTATEGLPFDRSSWERLDDAARYALWRLADPRKDPAKLAAAIAELTA